MSDSDDNIPTLNEMIFPGRPEKASAKQSKKGPKSSGHSNKHEPTSQPHSSENTDNTSPKQTNFETLINKQIDETLERHMLAAREEIVRVVMLELRSRLPNAGHKKS
jgi:hypothetical protein